MLAAVLYSPELLQEFERALIGVHARIGPSSEDEWNRAVGTRLLASIGDREYFVVQATGGVGDPPFLGHQKH
jgi:hypothetical protein